VSKELKKIVLASGIVPPDIGGPATYVTKLGQEFVEAGYRVKVLSYGDRESEIDEVLSVQRVSRKTNMLSRYLQYFQQLRKLAKWADIIYAQDLISVGLPCALLKLFKPKTKLVVRLGGDFLWEKAFNSGWSKQTLSQYHGQPKSFKEKIYLAAYRFSLSKFDQIIFSTKWQQGIYAKYFSVTKDKSVVISNAFPASFHAPAGDQTDNSSILFAGRLIKLKNLVRVLEAIKDIDQAKMTIVGDGPEKDHLIETVERLDMVGRVHFKKRMPLKDLAKEISSSHFTIIPSVSEVSPNIALESIRLNKPVLLTKESGFYTEFKDQLMFINPLDINDIQNKIVTMFDEDKYKQYLTVIKSIDSQRGWQDLSVEHVDLFKKILS
jgi:glycosyltransferase involved in cell wall biosynthesis